MSRFEENARLEKEENERKAREAEAAESMQEIVEPLNVELHKKVLHKKKK